MRLSKRAWSKWGLALVLLAGGCLSKKDDAPPSDAPATEASVSLSDIEASDSPSDAPSEAPPAGRSVDVSNELYEFSFAYPDAAGAIPALKDLLDGQMAQARSQLASSSRDDQKSAKKDGYPYLQHSYGAKWDVVTDLPGWLSLSAQVYTFSGGAHGMTNFDSLLWDRRADTARKPRDLFTGADALRNAIQKPFCQALNKEREKRRGEPVQSDSGQMFTECIDPLAQTLILGSTNQQTFDRIGILVAPYEAGPYAEGTYEVTVPVTGRVMAVLKPQYRTAFSVGQ